ncbi:carboxypeptidase-like regulatory domain-containing protein [Psychroserpens sp. SPM9]|uniref:carboxypeptidase-like regulatory domain-containing protein n=1 Tax=Psychroserpens sp. SPM9 TaxID=2975598 RepID=UPI0021A8B07A|nr:carboxypeptidase-like regulatory domain-containing protein [Psychroserpens sp. SPM9]MDG5491755.1 carboxypeptidase-like regulatory domain-containing protein [Psychroserpens sp. SPM9]
MKQLQLFLFFIIPVLSGAQTVKGYVYDAEATIAGAKLVNKTQNILTYSNAKGYFEIEAKLNDSLVVSSYFHSEQTIVIDQKHFGQEVVFELKKITNELDEVEITKVNEKEFDTLAFSNTTAKHGQIAFKERMFGSGKNLQPTLDLLKLATAIGKLFKRKTIETPVIKTSDFITLFETNSFFTQKMLRDELHIQETYEYLFFEYLTAQHLNLSLLSKDNQFMLLDSLLTHSKAFNELLTESQKD